MTGYALNNFINAYCHFNPVKKFLINLVQSDWIWLKVTRGISLFVTGDNFEPDLDGIEEINIFVSNSKPLKPPPLTQLGGQLLMQTGRIPFML